MAPCAVSGCKNESSTKTDKSIMFLKFPKNPRIKEQWIKFCCRGEGWTSSPNSIICSQHFKATDFSFCLMENLTNATPNRRRLKSIDAIPTIFNVPTNESSSSTSASTAAATDFIPAADEDDSADVFVLTIKLDRLQGENDSLKSTISNIREEMSMLRTEIQQLQAENASLKDNATFNPETPLQFQMLETPIVIETTTEQHQLEIDGLKTSNAQLKTKYDELNTKNISLKTNNDYLKSLNEQLKKVLIDKDAITDRLKEHATKMHQHNQKLQHKIIELEKVIENMGIK